MTRSLAIIAALLLVQLAACAGGTATYGSAGMMSRETVTRGYADAIQEGIDRAKSLRQFDRLPASADRPG